MIIQPTASHSDETIRIERDAYKQVVEAHQKTLATIEWAVGIIGSLIIILVGYIVFKNNKEYKDALEQAKEARHWEAEAKQILGSIDKQVKEEIENIKKQGKESIEKIDDKSEKERRVSELWNDAIRLHHEGRYEDVCEKYAEIDKIKSNDPVAYSNWGLALTNWAELKGDEKLFGQACQKFEQAVKIKPDSGEAYNNWGFALCNWAKIKDNEKLFEQACQKCEQAIKIKPNMYEAYGNWGRALGNIATLKGDEKLFVQACQKYELAIKIKPDDDGAYCNWAGTILYWAQTKIGTSEYESLLKQAEEKALKAESLKKGKEHTISPASMPEKVTKKNAGSGC